MGTNLQTVQRIYEAFGRGDVPAICAEMADDVAWDDWGGINSAQNAGVTYFEQRKGPDGVAEFFGTLMPAVTITSFAVDSLLEGDGEVVARISLAGTFNASGNPLVDEEIHWWAFDEAGKVRAFRHYVDTAKHVAEVSG